MINRKGLLWNVLLPLIFFFGFHEKLRAQKPDNPVADSTYFNDYKGYLPTRVYLSRKYSGFSILSRSNDFKRINYHPNSTLNGGFGATYDWLTINIAIGFKFLNPAKDARGNSNYLDIQSHAYGKKANIDFYGQFYNGYYFDLVKKPGQNPLNYYVRPDIQLRQTGLGYEYVLNWRKYSFKSAILQTSRQLKSAGTATIGGHFGYTQIRADQNMIPMLPGYEGKGSVEKIKSIQLSPSAGYAYTLVFAKKFYVMGSGTGQLHINFLNETSYAKDTRNVSVQPNMMLRAAIGYNSSRWSAGVTLVNQMLRNRANQFTYIYHTGNYRAVVAYRVMPGEKLKRKLKIVENLSPKKIIKGKQKKS